MSPFTYSISEKIWSEISFLPGYHLSGNICGRYYANVSVGISMAMALGKSKEAALEQMRGLLGNVPEGLEIPLVPLPRSAVLLGLPRMIQLGLKDEVLNSRTFWVCTQCHACTVRCPRGIVTSEAMRKLREWAAAEGLEAPEAILRMRDAVAAQ